MARSKETKAWAAALRRAVHRESEGKGSPMWLEVIANRVMAAAADGDMQAVKEIGDRLDGKAHQSVDLDAAVSGSFNIVAQEDVKKL